MKTKKIKRAYSRALANAGISGSSWYEYYAVFQTEKGKTIELQLPKDIYDITEEGNKGQRHSRVTILSPLTRTAPFLYNLHNKNQLCCTQCPFA